MQENTPEYEAYLIKLAETNIAKGVIEEPRLYTERLQTTNESGPVNADPAVFVNGEKFPVRLLYMTMNVVGKRADGDAFPGGFLGEQFSQAVGLRLRFHDQFYMRPEFVPLGNWGTQINTSSAANNLFTSSHKMWRPVVLSARDTLEVRARAAPGVFTGSLEPGSGQQGEPAPWRVTATATGVGIFSKRPYFVSSTLRLVDGTVRQFDGLDFKNDGAEPILITDLSYSAILDRLEIPPGSDFTPAQSVAPLVEVGVRQIGNGTNASWVINGPGSPNMAPTPNWGTYSGRALVHRFPGQGLIWEPGEGIDLTVQQLGYAAENPVSIDTTISLVGYIAIQ